MNDCKTKWLTIAYLGPEGTFCEQAARKYFSKKKVVFVPFQTIRDVFNAVTVKETDYGVVPVENSLDGSINTTLDLLLESALTVIGEINLRIIHNLITKQGVKMRQIKHVFSHAQALAQCRKFLDENLPWADLRSVSSTARAVKLIGNMKNAAAIGTDVAAKNFGLTVLKQRIEDSANNFTRFFILGKEEASPTGKDKMSIIFSAKHVSGSLYRCLRVFAIRNINLTKIESRPIREKPWKYVFYLDFEGHRTDEKNTKALEELKKICTFVKILGSYPINDSKPTHISET